MSDTDGQETATRCSPTRRDSRYEECDICNGRVDAFSPGHYKSASETFRHEICHENGEPPEGYVWEWDHSDPKTCMNKQFNCGHVIYGPPMEWPQFCPECNNLVHEEGEWNVA